MDLSTSSDVNGATTVHDSLPNGTHHGVLSLPLKEKPYRHVFAVHSRPKTSCLSHDSKETPSFLGFRNLMVIMLGMRLDTIQMVPWDQLGTEKDG